VGDPEIRRMVEFRERLRKNVDVRERYAATKRRLAARRWRHIQHYADAKASVIEHILARAYLTHAPVRASYPSSI
jgi:GrpB-like predicted nucleotidyltransferase (UPF0157 family)